MEGAMSKKGMPSLATIIDADESEAIRAYVVEQAWRAKRLQEQP
jgi:mono/diheme cytochrome c family protein